MAAKVAAALRVNGDTVGDDSLADLDDLTSGDLVATLAKIITGDVHIEAHSLQQAFAEANASLRQANTREYSIFEDEEYAEVETPANGNGQMRGVQQTVLSDSPWLSLPNGTLPAPGHLAVTNGHAVRQPSLFTNGQTKANGSVSAPNGKGNSHQKEEITPSGDGKPSVPRPRLLIEQLTAK